MIPWDNTGRLIRTVRNRKDGPGWISFLIIGAFYTTALEFLVFSRKSQPAFLSARFLCSCPVLYSIYCTYCRGKLQPNQCLSVRSVCWSPGAYVWNRTNLHKVIGVGFWTHCVRKSVRVYLGRSVTVETVLSAHMSQAVLEELAQDRNPGKDHDGSTQFILRVTEKHPAISCPKVNKKEFTLL